MAAEAPVDLKSEAPEPMSVRLERVLARTANMTPQERATALARAGVIRPSEIESVAKKLGSPAKRRGR